MRIDTSELVATGDIARELGVTTAAVSNWILRRRDFPNPVAILSTGWVFRMSDIRKWRES